MISVCTEAVGSPAPAADVPPAGTDGWQRRHVRVRHGPQRFLHDAHGTDRLW